MRYLCLFFSFLILFVLTFVSWWMLWDPRLLVVLANTLPRLHSLEWGHTFLFSFGAVCFVCTFSLFSQLIGASPALRQYIMFDNKTGSVSVSLDAIEDFIRRKGMAVPEVREIDARVETNDKSLSVHAGLELQLIRNIPEFTKSFQEMLRRELDETLGLKHIKEIKILIKKIGTTESTEKTEQEEPATGLLEATEDVTDPTPNAPSADTDDKDKSLANAEPGGKDETEP